MTTQEAIEILRDTPIDIRSTREDDIHTLYATAQGMAIEALQQGCEKVAESCDDLISRQGAVKVIKKMAWENDNKFGNARNILLDGAKELDSLPSAQPEIIRCKDCKDYQTDWKIPYYPNRHYCATMDSTMPEDGFCSYAERRTDGV